jgi:RNA polymerase sigma-70 factor (ECF subfamily)
MATTTRPSKTGSEKLSEQSFSQLVEDFQTPIFNLCYRMLGNRQEAEDATQETFVRAYLHYQQYDPARPVKTWLFSIAHHYCIDLLRKRRQATLISMDDFADRFLSQARPFISPEESLARLEESRYLQNLLANIQPEYRDAVLLRYWFDLSYDEIAAISGCSVSAAKSRVFRAKKQLSALHTAITSRPQLRPAVAPSAQQAVPA